MPFDSDSAKEAGKKSSRKGIPNGATAEVKDFYVSLLSGQQSKIEKELKKLEGRDYLNAIFKLSEYVIPKQRQVEQIIDLSKLSDEEIDILFNKAIRTVSETTNEE